MGHPYYQFYDDFTTFKNRCQFEDEEGHSLLFSNEEANMEGKDIDDIAIIDWWIKLSYCWLVHIC